LDTGCRVCSYVRYHKQSVCAKTCKRFV
jgi:hypothetical protein